MTSPNQLRDRRLDPDRRGDQSRQLRWPAAQRTGQGRRHQLADREQLRRQRRRRLRDSLRTRSARSRTQLISSGKAQHAFLGVAPARLPPRRPGATIGSGACRHAGRSGRVARARDTVTAVGRQSIASASELRAAINAHRPGRPSLDHLHARRQEPHRRASSSPARPS